MTSLAKPASRVHSVRSRAAAAAARQMSAELEELRRRLAEAEETLRAIRSGEADALIVSTDKGDQVFTLRGADRSYRALIEEMNEGALNLAPDGMILYANAKFASMLRAPLQQVIGSSIKDWVASSGHAALAQMLETASQGKCRQELALSARDGSTVPVILSATPVVMDGLRECLGVVATDLTEHKRYEQVLRESEAQFRHVFENAQLGKCLQGMDGTRRFNRAFCETLGYTAEELQARTWQDITHPEDIEATQQATARVLDQGAPSVRFEKRFLRKDGALVWADAMVSVGRDASGAPLYVLTSINDITARRQADAAMAELKQHLQRNVEMERLRLAQDLHDVPLQQLYAVIYKLEELKSRARPENTPIVEQAIADLQKTLNNLRATASELRPPALSHFGLEKAVRSYMETFHEKYPGVQVRYELARDGQLLPESLRLVLFRVLQESLANIVRHAGATEIRVRFEFDAEQARLEVRDNGKGFTVPTDWLAIVHEGHYGLAGMVERVSAAGGTLDIQSAPGASTTISAVIPYTNL